MRPARHGRELVILDHGARSPARSENPQQRFRRTDASSPERSLVDIVQPLAHASHDVRLGQDAGEVLHHAWAERRHAIHDPELRHACPRLVREVDALRRHMHGALERHVHGDIHARRHECLEALVMRVMHLAAMIDPVYDTRRHGVGSQPDIRPRRGT
jgi:hypothetical protein